jgi:Protein of unknown function (DUF1579)
MRKFLFFSSLMFLISISFPSFAQDDAASQDAMMKAWQEYMTPGPMHQMLAKGVGEWTADVKMWMEPGKPPTESSGTGEIKSILGGRYFAGTYNGTFNGMTMTGQEITGYDNAKKKFFNTWIDNFGTGIMHLEGTYDERTKTYSYSGTEVDPMSGNDVPVRETIQIVNNDHHHMEMFMTKEGQEFKTMEIDYTRKK